MSNESTDSRLKNRKALVVGAYGGIGKAVSVALAGKGVSCALMGRSRERLAEIADACSDAGARAIVAESDITQTETLKDSIDQVILDLDGLNYLINCAGVYESAKGDEGDLNTWDAVLDTNLRSTYHLTRHALPQINKSPNGAVIKIGSIPASYSGGGAYLATTRGLDGYMDALFEDVREYGTKVCTIRPGFVNTPMGGAKGMNLDLKIQPADIAYTVLFVLTMPATACPTEITIRPQRSPYNNS